MQKIKSKKIGVNVRTSYVYLVPVCTWIQANDPLNTFQHAIDSFSFPYKCCSWIRVDNFQTHFISMTANNWRERSEESKEKSTKSIERAKLTENPFTSNASIYCAIVQLLLVRALYAEVFFSPPIPKIKSKRKQSSG